MCTGYGGLDLAAQAVYGGELRWCADNDAHATALLHRRFPRVPNVGDLTAVDWTQVPAVDIVTAGFPCQDISFAGHGAGIQKGTRSGLWLTIVDALRVLRPGLVLLENVAALRTRGLATVLGGLSALGYDTAWICLRASDVGAPHRRDRMFIAAANPAVEGVAWSNLPAAPQERAASGQSVRCGVRRPAADPDGVERQRWRTGGVVAGSGGEAAAVPGDAPERGGTAPADPASRRWLQGQPEPARLQGGPDTPVGGVEDPDDSETGVEWGPYAPAIRRWEAILGRRAPQPTETGTRGQPRLSARFVEWMMGLPDGWVTDMALTRTAQLRLLGNGVVPLQAVVAFRQLDDMLHAGTPGRGTS